MAVSLLGHVLSRWPRSRRRAANGLAAADRGAERAHRLTTALAEREAGRDAFRRRWGAYVCHMPAEPYDDWLTAARNRR